MTAEKHQQAQKALNDLQEQLFDALSLLRCLARSLDADGHEDQARAASAVASQVSSIAIAFDEVLS